MRASVQKVTCATAPREHYRETGTRMAAATSRRCQKGGLRFRSPRLWGLLQSPGRFCTRLATHTPKFLLPQKEQSRRQCPLYPAYAYISLTAEPHSSAGSYSTLAVGVTVQFKDQHWLQTNFPIPQKNLLPWGISLAVLVCFFLLGTPLSICQN